MAADRRDRMRRYYLPSLLGDHRMPPHGPLRYRLANACARAIVKNRRAMLQCSTASVPAHPSAATLRQLTSRHVRDAVSQEDGNKLRAARRLGISRPTLYRLLVSPDA
jgi:DNA-binding NtrC family response regulator